MMINSRLVMMIVQRMIMNIIQISKIHSLIIRRNHAILVSILCQLHIFIVSTNLILESDVLYKYVQLTFAFRIPIQSSVRIVSMII